MATQDFPHHMIHIDVGQNRSFDRALANATGDLEPWAKLVFGTYSTTCVRVEVPKKLDVLVCYASLAEGAPELSPRYAIKTLFEIDIDRVQAGCRVSTRLDGSP